MLRSEESTLASLRRLVRIRKINIIPFKGLEDLEEKDEKNKEEYTGDEENSGSSYRELMILVNQCESKIYKQTVDRLELLMKLSSVNIIDKLVKEESLTYIKADLMPDIPKCLNESQIGKILWTILTSKPVTYLRILLINFLILNLNLSCFLLYFHDKFSARIKPSIANKSVIHLERCLDSKDIQYPKQDLDYLNLILKLTSSIGVILASLPGLGVTTMGVVGLLPIAFFHVSQIALRFNYQRVDFLNFLYEPVKEYRRIHNEVWIIIKELIESVEHISTYTILVKHNSNHLRGEIYPSRSRKTLNSIRVSNIKFIETLLEIREKDLHRPISVSSKWHKELYLNFSFMLNFSTIMSLYFPIISTFGLVVFEIFVKTLNRIRRIECSNWNSNAILIGNFIHLEELQTNEDIQAYNAFDNSLSSLVYLALAVESRYYFNLNTCVFLIAYVSTLVLISILSVFFINTFIFSTIDKIIWVDQLELQINSCLNKLNQYEEYSSQSNYYLHRYLKIEQLLCKQVTITYLNYELFRRQYPAFKSLVNFFLLQALTIAIFGFLVYFFFSTGVEAKNLGPTLITIILVVVTVNIYLIGSSYVPTSIARIMKKINILLAKLSTCNDGRLRNTYLVDLWRRQVLSDLETHFFYSASLFGTVISYENTLTVNAYACAIWLLLLKMNN